MSWRAPDLLPGPLASCRYGPPLLKSAQPCQVMEPPAHAPSQAYAPAVDVGMAPVEVAIPVPAADPPYVGVCESPAFPDAMCPSPPGGVSPV
jgi:hypothetical protein